MVHEKEEWDVFLSHDWGQGECGYNHARVVVVAEELTAAGLKVWVDEDGKGTGEMAKGVGVGQAMADGIVNAKVVVVCLTRNYSDKIDMTWATQKGNRKKTDNCLREFNLAVQRHGMLGMLPAVMEPSMLDSSRWGARAQMELGEMLYENLSAKEDSALREATRGLAERVKQKLSDPMASLKPGAGSRAKLFKVPFNNVFMAEQKAQDFAPGTRQWILERVVEWYAQPQGQWTRVFVLLGAAAVGKSTLAGHVSRQGGALGEAPAPLLTERASAKKWSISEAGKRLSRAISKRVSISTASSSSSSSSVVVRVGAVHLFNFGESERSDLVSVFMSISEQLCAAVPGLARELATVRQEINPNELRQGALVEAFRVLVARPCTVVSAPPERVVVVIDALDECPDGPRRKLLNLLQVEGIAETPDWFGFVITSRPEDYIPHELEQFKTTRVDAELEKNEDDMRGYLSFRLADLVASKEVLEQIVDVLTRRSEGKFLFARFLDQMLDGKTQLTLADLDDELAFPHSMKGVLRKYFERFHGKLGGPLYRALLMPMVVAREPLPEVIVRTILLEHTTAAAKSKKSKPSKKNKKQEREVNSMMKKAQNLLYMDDDGGLRFVHKSMADWLTDEGNLETEEELAIDPDDAHEMMAGRLADDRENRFALRHALWHLWQAEETDRANEMLLDGSWLLSAVQSGVDASDLVADADAAHGKDDGREDEVDDVLRVLELAAPVIRREGDPLLLASQLWGRLPPQHRALRNVAEAMPKAWLRPMQPTLTPARSALRKVLRGHTDWVLSVAISGNVLVSGSYDKTLRVWSVADSRLNHTLEGHTGLVQSVAVSGDVIVSGSSDRTVRVWSAADGRLKHTLEGHTDVVTSAAISGDVIVSGSYDNTLRVWSATSGRLQHTLEGHGDWVQSVAISGDVIVSGSADKTVRVWSAADGRLQHTLEGHTDNVTSVAVSGDVVVSGSSDRDVRVWSASAGRLEQTLEGHTGGVEDVAISGAVIVSGSHDRTVRVWNAADGRLQHTFEGLVSVVTSVAISGDVIVSGSRDETVRVWSAADHCLAQTPPEGHTDFVTSVAISGDVVVSGSRDETVRVWSATDGRLQHTLEGHTNRVLSVAISGDVIVSGSLDRTVRVWSAADGRLEQTLEGHTDWVESVAISRDVIVSGSADKTVRVWSVADGQLKHTLEGQNSGLVNSVAISGDVVVSGSMDKTVRVWSATDGRLRHSLEGHSRAVQSVAISGDVIVSGSKDKTMRVWSATSGRLQHTLEGHTDFITSVAISGDVIMSQDRSGASRTWSAAQGRELGPKEAESYPSARPGGIVAFGGDQCVPFASDGNIEELSSDGGCVVARADNVVHILRVEAVGVP